MAETDILFTPQSLGTLTLKNRFVGSAHEPAYGEGGLPLERYQAYLEEKARGGVALVMFGGSAMVSSAWSPSFGQLNLGDDRIIEPFKALSDRIHRHGAYVITQVAHPGRRSRFDSRNWLAPVAPGPYREPEHRAAPKIIESYEIEMIQDDFAAAVARCQKGGLDGVEVVFQAGQLLNTFLSPDTNQLENEYGGSLENRLRMGREILERTRAESGREFIVGVRMVGDELARGAMTQEECLEAAVMLAETGLIDYLNVVGGRAGELVSGSISIPNMSFASAPYLYLPSAIRGSVDIPVMMAQKISDPRTAARALADGHVDLVAMNRALLADPHFVRKLRDRRVEDIRLCVGANYCIDRIYAGGDALCIQNPATGRETRLPHVIRPSGARRRAVIVGGGPGGMEAARVTAERGHDVILFEAEARLGGQIHLASAIGWRKPLAQIAVWLEAQLRRLKVDLRLGTKADVDDVLALNPDIVVIATGGRPVIHGIEGAQHTVSSWDALSGVAAFKTRVLVFDDHGGHQALVAAERAASNGAEVEYVTPYRAAGIDLGGTNIATHLANLCRTGAIITTSQRLRHVYPENGRLIAVLRHEYAIEDEEREVDQVIVECGTLPVDGLYHALKSNAWNGGELDYDALRVNGAQTRRVNPHGQYQLFRIGDAVSQRNIHAAIYDAIRLLKDV